jgi:hypothetical protein
MNDLFSEDPQFRRVQWTKLSDNTKEWPQEIAALVAEKLPNDLGLDVSCVFQKVDDEKGYALGSAVATDTQSNISIGIPVIVKAWHVAPFDMFFQKGKTFPLSDEALAKAFYQGGLGVAVAPRKPPPTMADDAQAESRIPPMGGKYSYAAPLSMLDLLSGTLGADDIGALRQAAGGDPRVLAAFEKRGMSERLYKWAAEKPKQTAQDKGNKDRALAAMTVKKDSPNQYRIWANSDQAFDPVLITTDRRGLRGMLDMRKASLCDGTDDPFGELDHYGEVTLVPPELEYGADVDGPDGKGVDGSGGYGAKLGPRKSPFVFNPLAGDRTIKNIDTFGRWAVRDDDGVLARGWVIPNVVTFDGSATGIKLFLGKALASMQSRIAGIPVNDDNRITLEPDRPDTGKIGTWVYKDGDRVLATVPFQITSVTVYRDMRALSVVDYKGEQINLIIAPSIDGIVPITSKNSLALGPLLGPKKNFFISAKMFFVRMPRITHISESADDFKKTAAAEYLDPAPLKISVANGRYLFRSPHLSKYAAAAPKTPAAAAMAARGAVEGPSAAQVATHAAVKPKAQEVVKAAFDFASLSHPEAAFLLSSWGLGREKIAHVLTTARERIVLEVHNLDWKALPTEKTASELSKYTRSLRGDLSSLVKTAAMLDDAESVDAVLSLGFINPENIDRFAAARPMLEEVSSMLAKLLLASRLGMSDIPEEAARSALSQLQRIIEGLAKLKMLKEHTKSASPNGFGPAELEKAAGWDVRRDELERLAGRPLSWPVIEKLASLEGFAKWVEELKPAEARLAKAKMGARNVERYMKAGQEGKDVDSMVARSGPANRLLGDKAVGRQRPLVDPTPHGLRPGPAAPATPSGMRSTDFEFAGMPRSHLPPSLRNRGAA